MLSRTDLLDMCGLSEAEVLAIAEHEHLTEPAAAAMGHYLLQTEGGPAIVRDFIEDDIRQAVGAGRGVHAQELTATLATYLEQHSDLLPRR
jgi:hypothetical protein